MARLSDFEHCGSGWSIKKFTRLETKINISNPLGVASCGDCDHFLHLNLAKKHALLQARYGMHVDNKCLVWGVYAGIYHLTNPEADLDEITTDQLSKFIEENQIKNDFSMFPTWPVNVWYERADPGMKMFDICEEVNDWSFDFYTVRGAYQQVDMIKGRVSTRVPRTAKPHQIWG